MNDVPKAARPLLITLSLWALGLAATAWFGVYITGHEFSRQVVQEQKQDAQEQRKLTFINPQAEAEKAPPALEIRNVTKGCVQLTNAEFDGRRLTMFADNECRSPIDYLAWHWQLKSSAGVVINQGYMNAGSCPLPSYKGEKAECTTYRDLDATGASTLFVWLATDTGEMRPQS